MLHYVFAMLAFNMLWLCVLSTNDRAIRAYLHADFREVGRPRQAQRVGQQVFDVAYMDCLAREILAAVTRAL
jgi:RimJ/RimL family protein N-acetyltransferase